MWVIYVDLYSVLKYFKLKKQRTNAMAWKASKAQIKIYNDI